MVKNSELIALIDSLYPNTRTGIRSECGRIKIDKILVTAEQARFQRAKAVFDFYSNYFYCDFKEGLYTRLYIDEKLVMSNTPMEARENRAAIVFSKGTVLVGGLGLGMVIIGMLNNPNVKHITVVEKEQSLIDVVVPIISVYNDFKEKVTIVCSDIFKYKTSEKFDYIYMDIWPAVDGDNYSEMKTLNRKFSKNKAESKTIINHWAKQMCLRKYNEDRNAFYGV